MAKTFDLRKQLKLHDNGLLHQLFADEPAMEDVAWDSLGAHNVEPIVTAWEAMGEDRRRHYQVILHDVNELADPRGLKVLLVDLQSNQTTQAPERSDILNVGGFSDAVFEVMSAFLTSDAGRFVTEIEGIEL